MEGIPADLTIYIDTNPEHDHTYYGNGCDNGWGTSGEDGSKTPCPVSNAGGRFIKTADDETQKNGTYYNSQAATDGTGGAIATDNTNSSDTFCPLGWQLPYSGTSGNYYDKSKSWKYLLDAYSLISDISSVTKFRSYPLSYILPGYFTWNKGMLYNQKSLGDYWSLTISTEANTFFVRVVPSESLLSPQQQSAKAGGRNIRCDSRISILNSFPWHPRSLISIMAFHFLKAHFPSVKIMSNYFKNETKYFIFMELRANFDEAESKYKMENRILMSE